VIIEMAFRKEPVMKKGILVGLAMLLVLPLFSADVSAQGVTDVGKLWITAWAFADTTAFDTLFVMLCDDAVTPDADVETFATLTPIAAGNGYTSTGGIGATEGFLIPGNEADFIAITHGAGYARIKIRDIVWTASGGTIPSDYPTTVARWAVLTDNNATIDSRVVIAWWDLSSGRSVSDGNSLTLEDLEIRLTAP